MVTSELDYDWAPFDLIQQSFGQLRAGNRQTAHEVSQQLLDQYPNSPIAPWAQLAVIGFQCYSSGDFRKGVSDVTNIILENPDWPGNETLRNTIDAWNDIARNIEEAENDPENLDLRNNIGFRLLRTRALDLAENYFNYVLERDENNETAHLGMGYVMTSAGRTQDAVRHFEGYLAANPDDGGTLNQLGYAYLRVGDFDQAREMFRRYIAVDTTEANAYDSMGECLFNEGKYDESIRHYQKALQLDPSFSNSQFMLGQIYKACGDTANAITAYQLYLEMDIGGRLSQLANANLDSLKTE